LSQSGATLLAFQQEHRGVLPETQDVRGQRVLAIQSELGRIEREIDDLSRERRRLVRLHQGLRRNQSETYRGVQSYESRQLDALRNTLAQLPEGDAGRDDIVRRIASLTKRLADQNAVDATATRRTAFHDRVDEIDARIRAEEDRRLALVDELQQLEQSLAQTPTKAAELASLELDHANIRSLYDQALEAKAAAETGDAIETLSKGQRIAVIEQAAIPRIPTSPNRKLIALGGGATGVVVGFLVVLLLELRLGFLRRPSDLQRSLGITPIATLPNLDRFDDIMAKPSMGASRTYRTAIFVLTAILPLCALAYAVHAGLVPGLRDLATMMHGFL
ncbi:MAG: hypothetical protein AAGK57_13000, partial [Pseudomonadota bacterium]